jgi:bifunctional enzyme CysN/CysC
MADADLVMMAVLMLPLQAQREAARARLLPDHFIENFLDAPLGVCEIRDTKGLYKRARSGKIPNFTGIDRSTNRRWNRTCVPILSACSPRNRRIPYGASGTCGVGVRPE